MPKMLEVKNIKVYYDTFLALNDVSLHIEKGEIVALIGPNGAGKSTTLKAISGLLPPNSGSILFNNEIINGNEPHQLVRKGLSLVPEGRHVFYSMSVLENLEMGAFILNNKKVVQNEIEKAFSLFPMLRDRQKQKAGTLSTGEQQILSICRSLMLNPQLLLLDEPTLGLSPNYVELVFEKIREINKLGATILLVEQNASLALEFSNRCYVFDLGKISIEGDSNKLINDDNIRKLFFGLN